MKILHTSDWHLGMSVGNLSLEEDQRYFLKQLYKIIEEEDIDLVLCAGDVYDSSVSRADAIAVYNEAVTTICQKMKRKLVIIAGNHDGAARLASCNELLKQAGLYVSGRLIREVEPLMLEGAAIYSVPFFQQEEVSALFPEKKMEIRSQETAAKVVFDHIRETMNPKNVNVVVSHALIVKAELSESDRSARVGLAAAVSKDVFEGFDYVALGHIHKPQVISKTIRYSGSPVKYSFGNEEKHEKCVIVLDTETMDQKEVLLKQLHERKTVEGTYDGIMAREDLKEDYLRIRITDRYIGLDLLAQMREHFPYLLELYGKSLEEKEACSALSVEELQSMDEESIMKNFFRENFQYEPDASQIELFRLVLAEVEEEDELE